MMSPRNLEKLLQAARRPVKLLRRSDFKAKPATLCAVRRQFENSPGDDL